MGELGEVTDTVWFPHPSLSPQPPCTNSPSQVLSPLSARNEGIYYKKKAHLEKYVSGFGIKNLKSTRKLHVFSLLTCWLNTDFFISCTQSKECPLSSHEGTSTPLSTCESWNLCPNITIAKRDVAMEYFCSSFYLRTSAIVDIWRG